MSAAAVAGTAGSATAVLASGQPFGDPSGRFATFSTAGDIPLTGAFFQSLGTNDRRCVTCHQPADAWTVVPPHLQQRFEASGGRDPVFRPNDGANCPSADVSTVRARRGAYSLLLSKGLIRVALTPPATAEFTVLAVDNPYGCGDTRELSVYRRVLPSTNLQLLSTVMWDGRETFKDAQGKFQPVVDDLEHQAVDATLGHAQATQAPTAAQVQEIVNFELQLFTAQVADKAAGPLDAGRATGGPASLANQEFFVGINDPLGGNPSGAPFTPRIFSLYDAWLGLPSADDDRNAARAAIARGQRLFNTLSFTITGVGGLNDATGQATITGGCGLCHDSPNVGDHSLPLPLNIGVADAARRTADLPLFTLMNKVTGAVLQTTDPGRALVTGKWSDIGKFKGPVLRGLAARAPYFHNGAAATLRDVVNFYDSRFALHLAEQDKSDLVAFLQSL
ncbi:MAG: hypothetical protein JSR54_09290 [Proteobacteria bacterium]|nr:hypothetical protein [Pseudomonadota bacterium]